MGLDSKFLPFILTFFLRYLNIYRGRKLIILLILSPWNCFVRWFICKFDGKISAAKSLLFQLCLYHTVALLKDDEILVWALSELGFVRVRFIFSLGFAIIVKGCLHFWILRGYGNMDTDVQTYIKSNTFHEKLTRGIKFVC